MKRKIGFAVAGFLLAIVGFVGVFFYNSPIGAVAATISVIFFALYYFI